MFSLLPALVSVYFLGAAFYLWRHTNKLKRSHKAFLLLCITTFFWQATWAILFQTTQPATSELLVRLGYLLIIFLPTSLYQLLAELSNSYQERFYINLSYAFSGFLAVVLLTTDLFIAGYYQYFWGYYPKAGVIHWVHILQTTIVVLRGLWVTSKAEKTAQEPQKSILKCCKISVSIYFLAASDYLCNYGVEFYPMGILFVATSLTIIGYAMIKKDLFNVRAVISRTSAQFIIFGLIALTFFLVNGFSNESMLVIITANTFVGIIWAKFGERLCQALQTVAEKKWITDWYDATDILSTLLAHFQQHLDRQSIICGVAEVLKESMSIKSTTVYFFHNKKFCLSEQGDEPAIDFLPKIQHHSLQLDDVVHGRDIGLCDKSLVLVMRSTQRIEGYIALSSRHSENPYNSDDIKLLTTVAEQSKIFLDKANTHEEKLKHIKSLAGTIAHEMRNPLSQINGTLHLLWGKKKPDNPESEMYLQGLRQVINSSFQLIDITMDAINEKPIKKQNFQYLSAQAICREAISDYAYKEVDHAQKVSLSGSDFELFADPVLVKYILYNLMGNALYYVQQRSDAKIVISTFAATRQIEVRDNGPGIAPENISKLFDSFYTSGKTGGTGLGLAYCKRTMQALDGDIYCESELAKHTAFRLSFPDLALQKRA